MTIPPEFRKDADAMPAALRALLEAELAAGNTIAELGGYFPAPPAGAFFKLTRPVTTRPHESSGGLKFRDYASPYYSGSFTDDRGFYFILEPPLPPPPEPDMDAIRDAHAPAPFQLTPVRRHPYATGHPSDPACQPPAVPSDPHSALGRFEKSMVMDYVKWHDGDGYDLEAIRDATPAERDAIEAILLSRGTRDWRDVEALAALDTLQANEALKAAKGDPDPQIRLAVVRHAPQLVSETERTASLVRALKTANLGSGLTQALDEAADFHPKEVVETLLRGALHRHGEAAVQFAALLLFVHGKADSPFDWDQRPFFLRFNTDDPKARGAVFVELCGIIGVDPAGYL
jgi:hypothetical protein